MGVWTVWEHDKHNDRRAERAVFVRDGFSWSALLFGPLWLLHNAMIIVLIGTCLAAAAIIGAVAAKVSPQVAQVVAIGLWIWFAFEARGLRRWALARRGWRLMGVAQARNRQEAERRYYGDRLVNPPAEEPTCEHDVGAGFPLGHAPAIAPRRPEAPA